MDLGAWLVRESAIVRAVVARRAPEHKLTFVQGYQAALTAEMLVHGPGATDILNARHGGDGNSAVFACLAALATGYTEAPLRVYRETQQGDRKALADHPLQALLNTPNPFMSALEVWAWVQWAKHLDGNAYLRKVRSGNATRGNVTALWPLSPSRVELRSNGNDFISTYRYHWAPGRWDDLDPANVIHFRLGLDDADHRKGLAPLKRLVRAITTDERASEWTDTLLGNYALPGMMIKTAASLTQDQAKELAETAQWLYGQERKGKVGVMGNGADMTQVGFSPEQMMLDALHRVPETRITAVLRVPAIVAGLGAGLEVATYSNYAQARQAFAESILSGLWTQDEAKLQTQLVPDFTSDAAILVAHDLTDVRAFQEDEDKKYARLHVAVGGPFVTVNEARADIGLAPLTDGDVLYVSDLVTAVPSDGLQATLASHPPAPAALPTGGAATPPVSAPAEVAMLQAAQRLVTLVKADAAPAPITDAAIARAEVWARALDVPGLVAALDGTSNGNGRH